MGVLMTETEAQVWAVLRELYGRDVADRAYLQVSWMVKRDEAITPELVAYLAGAWVGK